MSLPQGRPPGFRYRHNSTAGPQRSSQLQRRIITPFRDFLTVISPPLSRSCYALLLIFTAACWLARPVSAAPESMEIRQGPEELKPSVHGVGRRVRDVAFRDLEGQEHRLSDFGDRPALVIALTGTGCPLCQKYAPTLAALEAKYHERGVAFILVNPNESEGPERAIRTHGFESPYVRDLEDELTGALGAETTTEVFVLDAARTLVYRGAVDDQYGFGYARQTPRRTFLADALDAVLAGRRPKTAATTSPGCELFFDDRSAPKAQPEVTYHNRISRILQDNCLECHRDGGSAPFPLETYQDVSDYAAMIASVIERRVMPPWFAAPEDSETLHWANDRSLAPQDRNDLLAWLRSDRPVGDPADAPLPRRFPDEWQIGEPDRVYQIPEPIAVKATGRMPYQYAQVETEFESDRWIQAVEVRPTARPVVHHVLVFLKKDGERVDQAGGFLAAYVPGNTHQIYPDGFAKKVPAGSKLVFQLHYTPNGTPAEDQTRLGLQFSDRPPRHVVRHVGIANQKIEIPPRARHHAEHAQHGVPVDVRLMAFMPHMHLRGDAFRFVLVTPDGEKRTLLNVPRYDFNWQLEYRLAKPMDVPRGSRIEVTGWYDNSAENPANPDPSKTVRWGPQTEDEMMLGYVEYYVPSAEVR